MKIIRLGQSLMNSGDIPPPQPPTGDLRVFYKKNTGMTGDLEADCTTVPSPTYSSDDSNFPNNAPISAWKDFNGSANAAIQATCTDRPLYQTGGKAHFDSHTPHFNTTSDITLTDEFTMYIKVNLDGTSNKGLIGGASTNFWRLSTNKEFRLRIAGTPNNLFTEVTNTITTNGKNDYVFVLQRNSDSQLSMHVQGGNEAYVDQVWGSTAQEDSDTMVIKSIGASYGTTQTLEGELSDVLIYGADHTPAERLQVYNYIS
tara:strand:- start:238 stop:1011 length:774 start_codon:yes stop_codon:yes gene_type:complete